MELIKEVIPPNDITVIRTRIAGVLLARVENGEDIFYRSAKETELEDEDANSETEQGFRKYDADLEKAALRNLEAVQGAAIFIHLFDRLNQIRLLTEKGIAMTTRFAIQEFGFNEEAARLIKNTCRCCWDDLEE
ncbi:MAG: hypothetical protein WCV72_05290 [Patescibacteria group bacterium]|jgi:hypothetical protein